MAEPLRDLLSSYGPWKDYVDYPTYGNNETGQYQLGPNAPFALSPERQKLVDEGYLLLSDPKYNPEYAHGEGATPIAPSYEYSLTPTAKAPKTQYGDITDVFPYDIPSGRGGGKLINPNLWYNDPNYGPVTPKKNVIDSANERDWRDFMGPLVMAAVTMGAGSLPAWGATAAGTAAQSAAAAQGLFGVDAAVMGGQAAAHGGLTSIPWYMNAASNAAKSIGSGTATPESLAMSALPGLSYFGIPQEVLSGVKMVNAAKGLLFPQQPQQPQITPQQLGYDPAAYGNMGSLAKPSDGSQHVATSVAPNAYSNSYTQVIS